MITIPKGGRLVTAALLTTLLTGCFDGSSSSSEDDTPSLTLNTLSSDPKQVSGDNVLVGLSGADADTFSDMDKLEFWVNDSEVQPTVRQGLKGTEILVTGLTGGDQRLELHHVDHGPLDALDLTVHPVTGPIFSGPQQYPFVCTVTTELNKQPLVDTNADTGFPVLDDQSNQIGLSRDCSIEPYVTFVYRTTGEVWAPLPDDGTQPADMATTELTDGRIVDFIVRQERGTINRFILGFKQ